MIGRICLLLEALSIVICLHHLYGKKFKLDIATISLLAIDMIMMTTIDYFGWPSTLSIIIYPIIAIYCGIEFGFEWKKIIINNILYIVIISGIQLFVAIFCYSMLGIEYMDGIHLLMINTIILLLVVFVVPKNNIKKLFVYLDSRDKVVIASLVLCLFILLLFLIGFKRIRFFEVYHSIILFVCVVLISILVMQLNKVKIKQREVETELKMQKLYESSFNSLIENIRLKQHEFDNRLNMIYSIPLLCDSYEELVEKLQEQCKELVKDNRYNKLLKNDNQIIRGFLYTNFLKAEKCGITVSYEIVMERLITKMPTYRMVEVMGDLINNAIEAMADKESEKRLHVSIIEIKNDIKIEVRNVSEFIPRSVISNFFTKGYSQKGENRGLGLYNVKKICDEYGYMVLCDNKMIEESNWISFEIVSKFKN